eukprot:Rmarinus@m.1311
MKASPLSVVLLSIAGCGVIAYVWRKSKSSADKHNRPTDVLVESSAETLEESCDRLSEEIFRVKDLLRRRAELQYAEPVPEVLDVSGDVRDDESEVSIENYFDCRSEWQSVWESESESESDSNCHDGEGSAGRNASESEAKSACYTEETKGVLESTSVAGRGGIRFEPASQGESRSRMASVSSVGSNWQEYTSLDETLNDVDQLHVEERHEENLELLIILSEQYPDSANVLWRLARTQYNLAWACDPTEERKRRFVFRARDAAQSAVAANERSAPAQKWLALTISATNEFVTIREKLRNSRVFRKHVEIAIALDPTDPVSHHLLARWCFEVCQLSWIERKVATAIFGEPPTSTLGEAVDLFLRAEKLAPRFWKRNQLMTAKAYLGLGRQADARRWLQSALALPSSTADDRDANDEIHSLLRSLRVGSKQNAPRGVGTAEPAHERSMSIS